VRKAGALSKIELSQRTGLSKQTLTDVIGRLEDGGLLVRQAAIRGRVGQPQVPFALNPEGAYSLGLKIGRKSYELTLIDFTGRRLAWQRQPIAYPTPDAMLAFAHEALAALRTGEHAQALARCLGLGVTMPNELWRWADQLHAPTQHLEAWRQFDVAAALTEAFALPVDIWNDVAGSCNAELTFGDSAKPGDFLYIYIGTFIGGGLVLNGRIFRGPHHNAGALGAMLASGTGKQLLAVASLIALVDDLIGSGIDPAPIWRPDDDWQAISAFVQYWIRQIAPHLAEAIVNAVAITNVSGVVIDGSFPPWVRAAILEAVQTAIGTLPDIGLTPFTVTGGTLGYGAQVLGAASLPLLTHFSHDLEAMLNG
jgi:predicted NBD/HSP70 family sugar kinase